MPEFDFLFCVCFFFSYSISANTLLFCQRSRPIGEQLRSYLRINQLTSLAAGKSFKEKATLFRLSGENRVARSIAGFQLKKPAPVALVALYMGNKSLIETIVRLRGSRRFSRVSPRNNKRRAVSLFTAPR